METIILKKDSKQLPYLLNFYDKMLGSSNKDNFTFKYFQDDKDVIDRLQKDYKKASDLLSINQFPVTDLIIFKGPGINDGHAVKICNKIYTFIDLNLYKHHLGIGNFDRFGHLVHELCHGVHYSLSEGFEPHQVMNYKDTILINILAEGMAVLLSQDLLDNNDNFWWGFILEEDKLQWIQNCEHSFHDDCQAILNSKYTTEQKVYLLGFKEFKKEDYLKGRRSYYHGYKLLKSTNQSIKYLLNLSPKQLIKEISKTIS